MFKVKPGYVFLPLVYALTGGVQACNTDAWAQTSNVTAINAASYEGLCGLRVDASDTSPHYVVDDTPGTLPQPVTSYVQRVYLYIGDLNLTDAGMIDVFVAENSAASPLFGFRLYGQSGQVKVQTFVFTDTGGEIVSSVDATLNPGWRSVELVWNAATGAGQDDGSLGLNVDHTVAGEILFNLDNDTHVVDRIHLGLVSGNSADVTGILDLDAFASQKTGSPASIGKNCDGSDVSVTDKTFLPGVTNCTASTAISLGDRVVFDSGASSFIVAPSIQLLPGTSISSGASVIMSTP